MTSRERLLATLAGDSVDRPFLWESGIWETALERWQSEGLTAGVDPYEYFGLERIACASVNFDPDPPFGQTVIGREADFLLIETEAGALIRRYTDPACPRRLDHIEDQLVRFPLRDRPSWQKIQDRLDPCSPERGKAFEAFVARRKVVPSPNGGLSASFDPADGMATAFYVMMPTYWFVRKAGFFGSSMLLFDDPTLVHEIFEAFSTFLVAQLAPVLAKRVPDIVFLNEDAAASKHGPIMSPEMYNEYAVPALARLTDMFREAGTALVFVHCGGDIVELVDTWAQLGANGLLPLDGPTDLAALSKRYPEMALIGGIHRGALQQDPKTLARHVIERSAILYANRRALPSGDVHYPVTSAVPLRNMEVYVKSLREAGARYRM